MEQEKITFIINSNTYSFSAIEGEAIRRMPSADRQQLIVVLEAVKKQHHLARATIQKSADSVKGISAEEEFSQTISENNADQDLKPDRLGRGDVDDLMARLVMEEKRKQKPGLSNQTIYKFVGGFAIIVIVLMLLL